MTIKEYFAIDALNSSRAKLILRSADHFKSAEDEPEPEATESQNVGTCVHAMSIEGKDLRDTFAIKPEGMRFSTKERQEMARRANVADPRE